MYLQLLSHSINKYIKYIFCMSLFMPELKDMESFVIKANFSAVAGLLCKVPNCLGQ